MMQLRPISLIVLLVSLMSAPVASAQTGLFLASKTPYTPRQDPATYEAPPAGFTPVFTQIVARHGSRGLSSPGTDLALYNMWSQALSSGGLTKKGFRLGADLQRVIRANALLGYGVPGITAPGYGNLTLTGIAEHTALAVRLASRTAPLLANSGSRTVIVSTSGVNRAVDSSNFFTKSLAATVPGLAPRIVSSDPLTAYPITKPVAQAPGVNRFQLYFHKLNAATDLPATTDPYYPIYLSSLDYQTYLASDPVQLAKVNSIVYSAASQANSRAVLSTIFTKPFLDALDNGTTTYNNAGKFTYTSDDGKFTTTITGDGSSVLANLVDAANAVYAIYSILPAMMNEAPVNFSRYIPPAALPTLAYLTDTQDFYQKGPGIQEATPITYKMSQALLDDFFREADAIAAGNMTHAAKLRFTHAEIIIPFADRLGLPNASTSVPAAATYTYDTNPFRGEDVAPLAANVQWDLYSSNGTLLVKMYYNEKETDFPASCEAARYIAGSKSHYYLYSALKICYGE